MKGPEQTDQRRELAASLSALHKHPSGFPVKDHLQFQILHRRDNVTCERVESERLDRGSESPPLQSNNIMVQSGSGSC